MLFYTRIKYTLLCSKFVQINRWCHTENIIRVRFAPSPTGYLHLGGLRTALYNYLFAKSAQGKFILRIEDTDQSRIIQGATEQLCKDLQWAGIAPDEGPIQGGEFGPYVQSERLKIYRTEVQKLLENESAYYCFCTERRLELLRKESVRIRQIPKYDNRCRHLAPGQIAEKLANHDTFCIRFKLNADIQSFDDLIYGPINYDVAQNEGDPIIVKSDGFPTYHFANVVDDHLMKISHVLRGVEWQISTTKHLQMYKAFGWSPPEYAHLPLIMNPDGSKLSKRQGDIQLDFYREKGILPHALINYITLSGGGFDRNQSKQYNSSMKELIEKFNIKRVNAHSSRLNPDLLDECNRLEILNQINDPQKCDVLIEFVRQLIRKTYPNNLDDLDLEKEHIKNVLIWAGYRLSSMQQLVDGKFSFLWILPKITNQNHLKPDLINLLIQELETEDFSKSNLQSILKDFAEKNELTFSSFMKTLRNQLSGLQEGPGVAEMMEILGKENTIQRIQLQTRNKQKKSLS